jgi:hypothetical protein
MSEKRYDPLRQMQLVISSSLSDHFVFERRVGLTKIGQRHTPRLRGRIDCLRFANAPTILSVSSSRWSTFPIISI